MEATGETTKKYNLFTQQYFIGMGVGIFLGYFVFGFQSLKN